LLRGRTLGIVGAALTCAISVGLSMALVDRPVATWLHRTLGQERYVLFHATYDNVVLPVSPFTLMASPAEALVPIAGFVFSVLVLAAAAGWRPHAHGRIAIALCLSAFATGGISGALKFAFGRTWPESWLGYNPSWIHDGVFGFFPFHGGRGWESFPSGHTTGVTSLATILWVVWPRLRIAWAILVGVVVAGLLGADYHFVSDIIAGLFLGVALGLGIVASMLTEGSRPPMTWLSPPSTETSSCP
jgi:membrane-associated phospholipid phosphatase